MDFVTIPDVELCSVGMNWPTAGGEVTLRFEHLQDAMVAANEDPHVRPPRGKIGHEDPRFNTEEELAHAADPFWDGEPALGSYRNLRLTNDGATLVGDWCDVPAWLGESAAAAFPSRSIEGGYDKLRGRWDVETPGGKKYSLVITAVAALGLERPAVEDIDDLRRFLVEGDKVVVAGAAPAGGVAAAGRIGDVDKPLSGRAEIDKVFEVFVRDYAVDDRFWWWPRMMFLDPNELIVDDDEGGLYAVPILTSPDQEVTFGDPREVIQVFQDAPAAARAAFAAAAFPGREAVACFSTREESPARERKGGVGPSGRTGGEMDHAAELRKVLGLEASATDEQVKTALAAHEDKPASEEPPAKPEETEEEETEEETGAEENPGGDPEPGANEPPAAASARGTVEVDSETWEQTKRNATLGASAAKERAEERREALLASAVEGGKFPPSRVEHYRDLHKADPKGTEELVARLAENLVPVEERGTSKEPDATANFAAIMDSYGASYGQIARDQAATQEES